MQFDTLPRGRPGVAPASSYAPRAQWADPSAIANHSFWSFRSDKVVVGRANETVLAVQDNRHLMTVAGSRAGKGVSCIIPNLLTYEGSMFVIDPKGENASITATRRGDGEQVSSGGLNQDVHVLDPFGVADVPESYLSSFNPFDLLDPASPHFIDDCDSLADALVVQSNNRENDYWVESARDVIRGLIVWVAAAPDEKYRDLKRIYDLLFLPTEGAEGADLISLCAQMSVYDDVAEGVPAQLANMLMSLSDKELSGVLATAKQQLAFLASPPMARLLSSENHSRRVDLKRFQVHPTSIYVCLPASRLHRHARFMRILLNMLVATTERMNSQPKIPSLLILDEMHVLGRMKVLETAAALIAGYGIRLWSFVQDLSQLKDLYRERWETFMGNAGLMQFFGNNDLTTLKYVSERLGQTSVMKVSQGELSRQQAVGGFTGQSTSIAETALLAPHEVGYFFSRQSGNQLLLYPGADPIFASQVVYFRDSEFKSFLKQGGR